VYRELGWDLLILELLKHDAEYHKILDVVWSDDEAGRRYFLHDFGGAGSRVGIEVIGRPSTYLSLAPKFLCLREWHARA